jgi:acyl carrier protein
MQKKNRNIKKKSDVMSKLFLFLRKTIKGNIPIDKSLLDIGLLDSFEYVKFKFFIEENWKIKFKDSESFDENFFILKDLEKKILKKIQKKN